MTSVAEALADGRIDLRAQAATPTHQRRLAALQAAISRGLLSDERAPSTVMLMDLDAIHDRIAELRAAFPASALHTVAVKVCFVCAWGGLRYAEGTWWRLLLSEHPPLINQQPNTHTTTTTSRPTRSGACSRSSATPALAQRWVNVCVCVWGLFPPL
jgi:hypothetical protein